MTKKAKRQAALNLGEIHHALLKYLGQYDPTPTRNAQIRLAIEFYVLSHPAWDPKRFKKFVLKHFVDEAQDAFSREATLSDLDRLTRLSEPKALINRPEMPRGASVDAEDFDV
jgi:hypothetical protein